MLGHPYPDGSWALLHRDRQVTARLADAQHPGDGEAWLDLCAEWDAVGPALIDALLTPFPPVRPALRLLPRLRRAGGLGFVRDPAHPGRRARPAAASAARARPCSSPGNAGHADIPLDAPGSGLMGLLMTMLGQTVGFPVPEGGAGRLAAALARPASPAAAARSGATPR